MYRWEIGAIRRAGEQPSFSLSIHSITCWISGLCMTLCLTWPPTAFGLSSLLSIEKGAPRIAFTARRWDKCRYDWLFSQRGSLQSWQIMAAGRVGYNWCEVQNQQVNMGFTIQLPPSPAIWHGMLDTSSRCYRVQRRLAGYLHGGFGGRWWIRRCGRPAQTRPAESNPQNLLRQHLCNVVANRHIRDGPYDNTRGVPVTFCPSTEPKC